MIRIEISNLNSFPPGIGTAGILIAIFIPLFLISPLGPSPESVSQNADTRPNVVMISLDTLRPDHMPCYGYPKNTSPFLCEYAENNTLFTSAYSQSSWTLPSQTSVFTSQYPSVHGVFGENRELGENALTLAEILRRNGYQTAAFVGSSYEREQGHYRRKFGLDQGFSKYKVPDMHLENTSRRSLKWLETKEENKPYFLFLQGYDVHGYGTHQPENTFRENITGYFSNKPFSPYAIRKKGDNWIYGASEKNQTNITRKDLNALPKSYNANIHRTDRVLENFIQKLRQTEGYENTIVIVYAGHGTNLNDRLVKERRITGHLTLHDNNIHVPLIIKFPNRELKDIEKPVELIDIAPTILDLAEIEKPERLQGESLLKKIQRDNIGAVFSEYRDRVSIRTDKWKLITPKTSIDRQNRGVKLYNIHRDPEEKVNLYKKYPNITENLKKELQEWEIQNQKLG